MRAGRAAGAVTAFLVNHGEPGDGEGAEPDAADCDFVVGRLAELDDVVRLGLPLAPGKLPNDLLAGFLAGAAGDDPAVLVPPRVGEDVAALDLGGAELLVAHGDPITLGGEDVGRAAVLVNVNDIAASGAEPRWLLATVLLPAGTTPSQALALLRGLAAAAARGRRHAGRRPHRGHGRRQCGRSSRSRRWGRCAAPSSRTSARRGPATGSCSPRRWRWRARPCSPRSSASASAPSA